MTKVKTRLPLTDVVFREHDIIVVNKNGSTENITKFPFGPEHNVIV